MSWLTKIYKSLAKYDEVQSVFGIVKSLLLPIIMSVGTAASGVLGHAPIMWIMMSTSLVFMSIMVAIYFIEINRQTRTPLNKLRYQGTLVNYDLMPEARQARRANQSLSDKNVIIPRKIEKVQIGVSIYNSAHFPISVFINNAKTEMEGRRPPRSDYPKGAVLVSPGNTVFLLDDPIEMGGADCKKLEGRLDMKVKYGLSGKEENEMSFIGKVEAYMQHQGFITQIYTHWESEQI